MEYQNGLENGDINVYYPNRKKKAQGSYRDGLKEGMFKRFHENGKLRAKIEFQNNEIVSLAEYDIKGKIVKK